MGQRITWEHLKTLVLLQNNEVLNSGEAQSGAYAKILPVFLLPLTADFSSIQIYLSLK